MTVATQVLAKSAVTHITECRLCDSRDLDLVVSFTPTPIGDHYVPASRAHEVQACYPLDVVCCRGCGAVQLADTVDPALIYPDYLYTTSVSRGLDAHFEHYAEDVLARVQPKAGAFVVDIGSNDGTLLRAFQRRGHRVLGIDPAGDIAQRATDFGIPTAKGFFTARQATLTRTAMNESADIITANHVMANVADLHDFIEGVKHLLAPDGTFVFETGYWPAIVGGNLIDTIEHEHLHYFSVKPLQQFLFSHGLTLVHAEMNSAKGGSLRGYVKHAYEPGLSVPIMANVEQLGGNIDAGRLTRWTTQLEELRQAVQAQIAQAEKETWVGYGAAVGSTLQLYHFGLGEKLSYLVDDNPAKQGRFSPGFHVPVYDPEALKAIKPDRIVILAWRYAEQIGQQHPEFNERFLTVLPELKAS